MTQEEVRRFMAKMGRRGGLIGGRRRMETMTPAARSASASHAARVRWGSWPSPDWWRTPGAEWIWTHNDGYRMHGSTGHLTRTRIWFRMLEFDSPTEKATRRVAIAEFLSALKQGRILKAEREG